MTWQCVKQIVSADAQSKVEFQTLPEKGLCRWQHFVWWHPCDMDEGVFEDGFWMVQDTSGLFGQLPDCEVEAKSTISWLQTSQ
ncbi:hypothetical protein [Roseibium sediminis]|uniref:hypothetical protein n=1 Tax=Roseibium sediminis TaxID=1775174 RepID=UPI00123DC94F|nr:hypothetical protein [Roseibium sediminis]